MNIFEKFMGKGKKDNVPKKKEEKEQVTNPDLESQDANERINVKEINEDRKEAVIEEFKEDIRKNFNPKYSPREKGEVIKRKETAKNLKKE